MFIQLVGHTTYVLLALSYLVRDIYWLRLISIPASLCSICFCYFSADKPIWLIIFWNIVFLAVNVYQLGILHISNAGLKETPGFARFSELLGSSIRPSDAAVLFREARLRKILQTEELLTEGEMADSLYFITAGRAEVLIRGSIARVCNQGEFLGDIGFLTNEPSTATVLAFEGTTVLQWNVVNLDRVLRKRPALNEVVQRYLSVHLRKKLHARESELSMLNQEVASSDQTTVDASEAVRAI